MSRGRVVNVQLLSDLHLEFFRWGWRDWAEHNINPRYVDILILAGDVATKGYLEEALDFFCSQWKHVVFVPGNHEYYGSWPEQINGILARAAERWPNLHVFPEPGVAHIMGLKIVAGTLWFPEPDPVTLQAGKWGMNDFAKIGRFEPWVYQQNGLALEVFQEHLEDADLVVSHNLPAACCVSERFKGSSLNHFFCHDLTELILEKKPPLWLFGHTHDRIIQQVGDTRLEANPLGYPGESRIGPWEPKLVFQLYSKHQEEEGSPEEPPSS